MIKHKLNIHKKPDLQIEVVGAKEFHPEAWEAACACLADCLVDLLKGKQALFPIKERQDVR